MPRPSWWPRAAVDRREVAFDGELDDGAHTGGDLLDRLRAVASRALAASAVVRIAAPPAFLSVGGSSARPAGSTGRASRALRVAEALPAGILLRPSLAYSAGAVAVFAPTDPTIIIGTSAGLCRWVWSPCCAGCCLMPRRSRHRLGWKSLATWTRSAAHRIARPGRGTEDGAAPAELRVAEVVPRQRSSMTTRRAGVRDGAGWASGPGRRPTRTPAGRARPQPTYVAFPLAWMVRGSSLGRPHRPERAIYLDSPHASPSPPVVSARPVVRPSPASVSGATPLAAARPPAAGPRPTTSAPSAAFPPPVEMIVDPDRDSPSAVVDAGGHHIWWRQSTRR